MRTAIFALALAVPLSIPFVGIFLIRHSPPPCIPDVLTTADRMGATCYEFSKNPSGREKDGVTTLSRACRREVEAYRQQREGCK